VKTIYWTEKTFLCSNIYKDIRKKDNYGHLIVDYKKPAKERFRTLNKIYKIEDNVAKQGISGSETSSG
jgi:hypothetical protein